MNQDITIRQYQPQDKKGLRKIAADCADRGQPIENIFKARETFADIMTLYYTNFEPKHCWVALDKNKVVGYLTGSLKPLRCHFVSNLIITPLILLRSLFNGVLFRTDTQRFLLAGIKSLSIGGLNRKLKLNEYPAHLHINLDPQYRGQKIGNQLAQNFFAQARKEKIPGIHLSTRAGNVKSRKFFSTLGFKVLGRFPMFMPNSNGLTLTFTVIYGKKL